MAPGDVLALEQEHVGAARQDSLGAHVEPVQRGAGLVVVAAAVRRVGADHGLAAAQRREAGVDAALGAVPVQHVRGDRTGAARHRVQGCEIGHVGVSPHWHPGHAQRQAGSEVGERLRSPLAAGRGVADDPDAVPRRRLEPGEVHHVPEQAADGGTEYVQDAAGRGVGRAGGHDHGKVLQAAARGRAEVSYRVAMFGRLSVPILINSRSERSAFPEARSTLD